MPYANSFVYGALMLVPTEATQRYMLAEGNYDECHAAFNNKNNAKISSIKQKVKQEIQVAINQVVKERGIGLLLHPNSEILYFDDEVNITDDVKAIYDAQ